MAVWLAENYIEILGVILSILYLILSIKQNIFLWPVGISSAVLYVVVFFQAKFYADMGLNVYYFFISIYGWINWSSAREKTGSELPVTHTGARLSLVLAGTGLIIFILLGYLLDQFTDSPIPYWDAFTTSASIIATWMLTRKILQHWLLWIVVDAVSMGLYIYRDLYPTAFLFLIYTLMAVIGYRQWRKSMRT